MKSGLHGMAERARELSRSLIVRLIALALFLIFMALFLRIAVMFLFPKDNLFVSTARPEMILKPLPKPGAKLLHDKAMAGYRGTGISVNAFGQDCVLVTNDPSDFKAYPGLKIENWVGKG
ncbi:MAG: hypothetical protein WC722_03790 [Rhodospirillales bacterium]|jgi:hypothetical protein